MWEVRYRDGPSGIETPEILKGTPEIVWGRQKIAGYVRNLEIHTHLHYNE
jgi:hypothetical protein